MGSSDKLKVLIVEDELLVRVGIKSSIDWSENGFVLVGEAEDGNEAILQLRTYKPDIVLLDIHLPGISGLEVLKVIRAELPKTKVIIISGMDDFETTRMAFQLGAYEYFHKPRIRSGDLLKMLKKLRDSFEGENKRSELKTGEATTQELLEDALRYPFEEEAAGELSRRIPMVSYCIMLVSLLDIYEKKKKNPKFNAKITFNAVVGLISELTSRRRDVEFFSVQSNEYFFLFRSDCMGEELLECVENFYTNLASMLNRFVDVNIHAGVSSVKHQYGDLPSAVQEAREANDHYFITENAFIQFTEIHINPADAREVTRLLGSLIDSAKQTQIDRHMECLQNLVTLMRRKETPNRKTLIHSAQSFIYYLAGVQYYEVDEDVIRIASCETLDQFLESYQGILEKLMTENSLQLGHDVVIQLREYLQTHFAEDISLQSLADEFHMSKAYISRVFKSEMGDNLFSYLNILRVEKSKQMLKGTGLKIYEIAAAVGYKSTVSFNYAFNRIVGESPSQYRERKRGAAGVEENPKGTDFSGSVPGMRE